MKALTIFTPTYNRGYILHELKRSLDRQDDFDFEWLIIDDGSTDNTAEIVGNWQSDTTQYEIRYYKVPNGGKPRAINKACELANTPWLFIVDSDDHLADNIIVFIKEELIKILDDKTIVGLGGLRGHDSNTPWKDTKFSDSVIASQLERPFYGLNFDCNEVYRVETLRQFPFEVWPGEIFTPEAVVLNEMSLQGYKLKWFNRVFVVSEYLEDGMTKGAWNLIKKNPMGYAMMYNHKLKYQKSLKQQINNVIQFLALIIYARNIGYITKCNNLFLAIALFPIGWLMAIRRNKQFMQYCK